ncbi:hypothetical protein KKE92_04755 [Candidatus Micrarchaeota archaeon]|nr:hypothetical protein [Candidatus Micrarchaeota archaeon]
MAGDIEWKFVLLEGYCMFNAYSTEKKVRVNVFPDGDLTKKPVSKLEDNDMYLPKSKLKRPKNCPREPSALCLSQGCRFFGYSSGKFNDMTHDMFKHYRKQEKR